MADTVDKLVRFSSKQKEWLEDTSDQTNLSENELVRRALNEYMTNKEVE